MLIIFMKIRNIYKMVFLIFCKLLIIDTYNNKSKVK